MKDFSFFPLSVLANILVSLSALRQQMTAAPFQMQVSKEPHVFSMYSPYPHMQANTACGNKAVMLAQNLGDVLCIAALREAPFSRVDYKTSC